MHWESGQLAHQTRSRQREEIEKQWRRQQSVSPSVQGVSMQGNWSCAEFGRIRARHNFQWSWSHFSDPFGGRLRKNTHISSWTAIGGWKMRSDLLFFTRLSFGQNERLNDWPPKETDGSDSLRRNCATNGSVMMREPSAHYLIPKSDLKGGKGKRLAYFASSVKNEENSLQAHDLYTLPTSATAHMRGEKMRIKGRLSTPCSLWITHPLQTIFSNLLFTNVFSTTWLS